MSAKFIAIIFLIYFAVYTSALKVRRSPESDRPNNRIINGFTPGQFEVPWVVLLRVQFPGGSISSCSGTIISPRWVVTAGHCAQGAISTEVQLGLYNRNVGPAQVITVPASNMVVHPSYVNTGTATNDIALLFLNPSANTALSNYITSVPNYGSIQRITYACPTSGNFAGRIARACGWGITSSTATDITTIIQCVDMPVITNTECSQAWQVQSTNICTRNVNSRTACHGDSGGPLVTSDGALGRLKLIGATSFGSNTCTGTTPDVFTRITSYNLWITSITGVFCDPS